MTIQQALINSGLTIRVYADVREGSLISQPAPNTGTEWITEKDSIQTAGSYYQDVRYTDVPVNHPVLSNLPNNCWL